jgi:hypothetical protein
MNDFGLWLNNRAEHGEAEPLFRRALAVDENEKSFGPEHPEVAIRLNNLAELLSATNQLAEAEPLFRQVLRIFAEFGHRTGHEHPHFRIAIDNYAGLISAMGLSQDVIAARVRSAIEGTRRSRPEAKPTPAPKSLKLTLTFSLPRSVTGTLDGPTLALVGSFFDW